MTEHLRPDVDAMIAHLMHLHGDQLDGLVEIAWGDDDGTLSRARLFDLGELDEAGEHAAKVNAGGANVYVGAALRQADADRDRRASDRHFLRAPAYWVDLDDGAAVRAVRERCGRVQATFGVVTGRHPEPRAQLYWRLEETDADPEHLRRVNAAICHALGGDPASVNPGRVLRLGGSIAWPVKRGRVPERTEFHAPAGRPAAFDPTEVWRQFPEPPASSDNGGARRGASSAERWVRMLAEGIGEGERDVNLTALCGHLLARRVDPEVTWHILDAVNATRVHPPLPERQLDKIFDSILSRELAKEGR